MVKHVDGIYIQIRIPILFECYDFYVSLHITTQECIEQVKYMLNISKQTMFSKEMDMLLRREDGCFLSNDATFEQLQIQQGEILFLL